MEPLILLLIPLLPLAVAIGLTLVQAGKVNFFRQAILATTTLCLAGTLFLFVRFPTTGEGGYHFVTSIPWLPALGIQYQVGVDGIGLTLVLLHALVSTAGAFVSLWIRDRVKEYSVFYLLLVSSIYGVFTSLDLFFLYLFYEMSVIPMYPLIGIWGSRGKEYASMKLTVYITAGAVLALAGILCFYSAAGLGTFDLIAIRQILGPALPAPIESMWLERDARTRLELRREEA